jgi:hypothetical protein
VRWDRAGVHWAIRRQLVVKLARFPGRKRHTTQTTEATRTSSAGTPPSATRASAPCRTSALDQLVWPGGR